jgi:hypothetical protein
LRARWRAWRAHPLLQIERRRVRRRRWWPGRRFFLFYPALLGVMLAYGVVAVLGNWRDTYWSALLTGAPLLCGVSAITSFLASVLPWVVPAFTATTIAQERERGTLDLLRVTTLSERALVWGKLGGCAVRLGPALLALALLTPFQAAWAWGGAFSVNSLTSAALALSTPETDWLIVWGILTVVVGWLQPWGTLLLNAAVGLLSSTLAASSGVAVIVTYGAILVLRFLMGLAQFVLGLVWMALSVDPVSMTGPEAFVPVEMLFSNLLPLGFFVLEVVLAILLVEAAIWRMKGI